MEKGLNKEDLKEVPEVSLLASGEEPSWAERSASAKSSSQECA